MSSEASIIEDACYKLDLKNTESIEVENSDDSKIEDTNNEVIDSDKLVKKVSKSGVIYITRIPPLMSSIKLRQYMSQFGEVGRIYLTPEDKAHRKQRLFNGGSKKQYFIDGWVEFKKKKIAKNVEKLLNNETVGGKKRHNIWRDDIWNIRYLPKFKWTDLINYLNYKKRNREDQKRIELFQAKKENSFYIDQVAKKKKQDQIQTRIEKKKYN